MEREETLVELRRVIEEAFEDIPYPGDHNITDENCCPECQEVAEVLRGRHWREINDEFIEKHWAINHNFLLVRPAALRYFLPGLMIFSATDHETSDSNLAGNVPHWLIPQEVDVKNDARFLETYEPLTPEQKRAVKLFLEYLIEAYPDRYVLDFSEYTLGWPPDEEMLDGPMLALKRYWGNK